MADSGSVLLTLLFKSTLVADSIRFGEVFGLLRRHTSADFRVDFFVRYATDRQHELLEEFEEISRGNAERHNPKAQGRLDRVREFFSN
jgi:hypothetical protein